MHSLLFIPLGVQRLFYIRNNILYLFKAVVVLGEDGEIGHLGADLAHAVAAQLGAVAAAAEHHHQPVRVIRPQGGEQALGGDLVVGVVQQDGELFADGHQLHAALDHAAAQALVDGLIRQAQHLAHADGGQGVVNTEQPRHAHLYVQRVAVRLGQGELNAQHLFVAQQAVLLAGAVVHLGGVDAIGNQLAGVAFQQGGGVLVVNVHHTHVAALEQLSLPAAVLLKGLVLAGADVVGREIRKDADVVVDARHAIHHEALTGHLHQSRIAARVQKLPEGLLQLVAFRGGVGGVLVASHIVDAVGADHAHLAACGLQHALDHVGGGGLALGAGDADHGHPAGGIAEEIAAHEGQRIAAALHLQHSDAGDGREVDVVLDDQRRDPLGRTLGGIVMAVPLGAHDADEEPPRGRLAAVVDDVLDVMLKAALHQRIGHALQQLFQFHGSDAPYCCSAAAAVGSSAGAASAPSVSGSGSEASSG